MLRNALAVLLVIGIGLVGGPNSMFCQNIPPMIGDQVGKPKIVVPNPLSQAGQQRDGTSQTYSTSAQDAEIHSFLDGFAQGLADRDLEKIGACYSQQPGLVVYWYSLELRGWEAVQARWQKTLSEMGSLKLTLNDPDIHVFGRFAWVTAKYHKQGLQGGNVPEQDGHVTLVLEKKRAQWLILHEHVSKGEGS
jgi:ketosteroid isomerase-like protein